MSKNLWLSILALPAAAAQPWIVSVWAPQEASMGDHFRIFFLHLPLAWWGLFSLFTVFLGSIFFLAKRTCPPSFERWAQAATETGVLFSVLALATGMVWAKAAWGVWWRWEPKLFTTLLLCIMYVVCILLRHTSGNTTKSKIMCAVFAILAFVNVPFIFLSSRWLQGAHPPPLVLKGNMATEMLPALLACLAGMGIVWLAITRLRFDQINLSAKIDLLITKQNRERLK